MHEAISPHTHAAASKRTVHDRFPALPSAGFTPRFVALALVGCTLCSLLVPHLVYPERPALISAFAGVTAVMDSLTAFMLFDLFCISGESLYMSTMLAYLCAAVLVVPYGFMFPGISLGLGSLADEKTSLFLWIVWHAVFPAAALLGPRIHARIFPPDQRRSHITVAAVVVSAVSVCVAALTITLHARLPVFVRHGVFTTSYTYLCAIIAAANFGACYVLGRTHRNESKIPAWVGIALLANGLDIALNAVAGSRWSVPWYIGKIEMVLSASIIIVAIMRSWAEFYASSLRMAAQLESAEQERVKLQHRYEREHTIAAELQLSSLPSKLPQSEFLQLRAVYRPAVHDLQIGGDWYDAFLLEDGRLVVTLGDVIGNGLRASIIMGRIRQTLRIAALANPDPASMMRTADRALRIEHPDSVVTAFVAVLDRRTRMLSWVSAGHPPTLIRYADGAIEELACISLPLGLRDDDPPTTDHYLRDDALIVAYTDGLVEADHDIVEGMTRLAEALADDAVYTSPDSADAIFSRLISGDPRDDIAVITLAFQAEERSLFNEQWVNDSSDAQAVAKTRADIQAALSRHYDDWDPVFEVQLAYSELVGNVVRYAPGTFETTLVLYPSTVAVTVKDRGTGFIVTESSPVAPLAQSGRGLFLIDAISSRCDIRSDHRGTTVHVTFSRPDVDVQHEASTTFVHAGGER